MNIQPKKNSDMVTILQTYNKKHEELLNQGIVKGAALLMAEDIKYMEEFNINLEYYKLLKKSYPRLCILTYLTAINREPENRKIYMEQVNKFLIENEISINNIKKLLSKL